MIRIAAPLALALLAGCGRPAVDQPTPGADGVARAEAARRATGDIRAALEAARGPAPEIAPPVRAEPVVPEADDAPAPRAAPEEVSDLLSDAVSNGVAGQ